MRYSLTVVLASVLCGCGFGHTAPLMADRLPAVLPVASPSNNSGSAPSTGSNTTSGDTAAPSSSCNTCSTATTTATTTSIVTYYLSPSGSDSNPGTSSQPWKTFAHAIPKLAPGYTLKLLNGTYTGANSGYPFIACSSNAKNGTATAPITIMAQNERQAFIKGNGTAYPFIMLNCTYWNVQGLHIENGDFDNNGSSEAKYGDVMYLGNSSYLAIRRNILARNNRYANSHLMDSYNCSHSLFEENEFYYFHRHGILDAYGSYNTFRRNYLNSRGYADISGGRYSSDPTRGDTSISLYPAQNEILENNISEGSQVGSDIQCAYVSSQHNCNYDEFFGNISLHDKYGHVFKARGTTDLSMPHNTKVVNDVAVGPLTVGTFIRANKNASCTNCMVLDIPYGEEGFLADGGGSGETGDGYYSVAFHDVLSVSSNNALYGLAVLTPFGSWTWSASYANAHGHQWNYYPILPNSHLSHSTTMAPDLGSCKVWIPSGSSMKGAGANGSDIGADILYRYQGGVLTTQKLWDPITGQFPHGALVTGLNDVSGSSAFDVQKRLNVNANGCTLPSWY